MRLPDFLIIGAMKAGTTTLHEYLSRNPQIFMSATKETQFFSQPSKYSLGLASYSKHFEATGVGQIAGESSTCYSRYPFYGDVPSIVKKDLPNVKLIYVMRHPAERAYSHYVHNMERRVRRGEVAATLGEAVNSDLEMIVASQYDSQIEQWLKYFDREQIHLCIFEDLVSSPTIVLSEIAKFLGVDPQSMPRSSIQKNKGGHKFADVQITKLMRRFKSSSVLKPFADALPSAIRNFLLAASRYALLNLYMRRRLSTDLFSRLSEFDMDSRSRLNTRFSAVVSAVELMLDRELDVWRT
jgi:Sulfotransferase domain